MPLIILYFPSDLPTFHVGPIMAKLLVRKNELSEMVISLFYPFCHIQRLSDLCLEMNFDPVINKILEA